MSARSSSPRPDQNSAAAACLSAAASCVFAAPAVRPFAVSHGVSLARATRLLRCGRQPDREFYRFVVGALHVRDELLRGRLKLSELANDLLADGDKERQAAERLLFVHSERYHGTAERNTDDCD
jgi:hypothetical protein